MVLFLSEVWRTRNDATTADATQCITAWCENDHAHIASCCHLQVRGDCNPDFISVSLNTTMTSTVIVTILQSKHLTTVS